MKSQKNLNLDIVAVDLFCGAGGLTHGLIKGGINVVAGIDVDPTCKYPFEKNNDAIFIEQDIENVNANDLKVLFKPTQLSLLAGCAPCQPFSSYSRSGRNKKYESQWPLLLAFGSLVKEIKPDLITMENVPQLAEHEVFNQFLDSLDGYHKWWSIIECTSIGIPQTRKRLVLIASKLGSEELSIKVKPKLIQNVKQAIGSLPPLAAGTVDPKDPLHAASSLSEINLKRIKASKQGGTWRDWPKELQAKCHQKSTGATYPSVYGRMSWQKPAPTITTQCFGYGNGRFGHPVQDRAISLREAAILQTFPKNYMFAPKGEKIKFTKMGRLIGNAVPVRLGEVIAETLVRHVNFYKENTLKTIKK